MISISSKGISFSEWRMSLGGDKNIRRKPVRRKFMKKIWQKSLASMVSAALCLTAFVGCLTVNAATAYTGTITSKGATVAPTDAEATVKVTLASEALANTVAVQISSKYGALTAVKEVDTATEYYVDQDEIKLDEGKFFVHAKTNAADKGFATAELVLTFAKAANVEEKDYEINIKAFAGYDGATYNEDTIDYVAANPIYITVKSATTKPIVDTSVRFATDILIQEKAAIRLRLLKSTFAAAGYSDYNITVDYGCYIPANNFSKAVAQETHASSEFNALSSTVDYLVLACQAMYEINLPIKVTANYLDAEGNVVAYNVILDTTLKDLLVAKMPTWVADSNQQATCTQIVDLVNYATSLQNYFGEEGSDLAAAEKINVRFEDYQATYASTQTDFNYNTTFNRDTTATVKAAVDYVPGASNDIRFRFLPGANELDRITIDIAYTNGYNKEEVKVSGISGSSLEQISSTIYAYTFSQLALYDFNKTVTATIYVDGTPVNTVEYCLENYVYNHFDPNGTNYSTTSETEKLMLASAMRFAASSRVAFGIVE